MVYLRSDDEIKKISTSCQIVADTLNMIKDYVKPGAKVSELDSMAEDFIISRGARPAFKGYMGFPSTLRFLFLNWPKASSHGDDR